ncbi:MAG: helix-turn-helix domain-containing protein [Acidimicrobiia bacterium]|nr:helix-turn-helix domain-containing protein [Acidimicrobiia bacterium]
MAPAGDAIDKSALGQFIRSQRQLADLSQRELAKLCKLSDPYLSQLERGRHDPTIRVLRAIAEALNIRASTLLAYAGWLDNQDDDGEGTDLETAIAAEPRLTAAQRSALVSTFRAFIAANHDAH